VLAERIQRRCRAHAVRERSGDLEPVFAPLGRANGHWQLDRPPCVAHPADLIDLTPGTQLASSRAMRALLACAICAACADGSVACPPNAAICETDDTGL